MYFRKIRCSVILRAHQKNMEVSQRMREEIISLSGIYQQYTPDFFSGVRCTDLTGLSETKFFCGEEAAEQIRAAVSRLPLNALHWIDSGDYHYVSLFWLEQIRTPFTLVMMDHHTDMQESAFGAGLLSCGSWLMRALETLPLLNQVILIGPPETEPEIDPALAARVHHLTEDALKQEMDTVQQKVSGEQVYISFDKDILDPAFCVTGWTQGTMTPDEALALLARISKSAAVVIGIDLCGEPPLQGGGSDAAGVSETMRTNQQIREGILKLNIGGING